MLAYIGRHIDIVDKLLQVCKGCSADDPDTLGATPLFWAVEGEHYIIMSTLVRLHNVNISYHDEVRRAVILWAAENQMTDTLARLLKLLGIDANVIDNKGKLPYSWVVRNGCTGADDVFLRSKKRKKASSDNDKRGAISWLIKVLNGGCPSSFNTELIQVNLRDSNGRTALSWAVENGHKK